MHIPDLATACLYASGEAIRAVGWLEQGHEYPTGKVRSPSRFLRNLQTLLADPQLGSGFPLLVDMMGTHTCDFCGNYHDTGELFVPYGDLVFIAPKMIAHYVQVHAYLPPPEFVKAVNFCPRPSAPEYRQMMLLAVRNGPGGRSRVITSL